MVQKFLKRHYPGFAVFNKLSYAYIIAEKRIDDIKMRELMFWLPDFSMYLTEKDQPVLYLSEFNPLQDAWPRNKQEIIEKGHVNLWDTDISTVLKHPSTVRVELRGLSLKHAFGQHYDAIINLESYPNLQSEQLALVKWVYCRGERGEKVIETMLEWGITETEVGLFGIEYIRRESARGAIGSVARLDTFKNNAAIQLASSHANSKDLHWYGTPKPTHKPTVKYQENKLNAVLVKYVPNERIPALKTELDKIKINGR